ncbi:MAG: hypothetical protein BWY45_02867 [Euryarchaeota archaeon ADurb.Bin294]|nr:MAG: hypothetical protein BWY45_02867 [Euryarchaeota archaeon ADurb.Bin294]HPY60706.1 hypothetical protein [Methanospirillum sp.]
MDEDPMVLITPVCASMGTFRPLFEKYRGMYGYVFYLMQRVS